MGVAVSNWSLARAVSQTGQLGVVSGTALGTVLVRRLQDGEPETDYLRKGGAPEETLGRKCVCNGLVAGVGMAQTRKGEAEPILLTAGDDARRISDFLKDGENSYTAADVVARLTEV